MKPNQITPGSWKVAEHFGNDGERYITHSAPNHPHAQIAVVASQIERKRKTPYDAPDAERDANARLIAAAPELLASLELAADAIDRVVNLVIPGCVHEGFIDPDKDPYVEYSRKFLAEARQAIAAAKGEA